MSAKQEITAGWLSCGIAIASISIPFVAPFLIPVLPSTGSLWTLDGWIRFFLTKEGPIAIWLVELVALMAGIWGGRTQPGQIGIALSIAISLVVLVCLCILSMLTIGTLNWD